MKVAQLLPLAALTTAFVIPDEQVATQLVIEPQPHSVFDRLPSKESILDKVDDLVSGAVTSTKNALDDAFGVAAEVGEQAKDHFLCMKSMTAFDTRSWLQTAEESNVFSHVASHDEGHHGHHGHHKHKANLTVFELIAKSKYTTKLAALISEDAELVAALNGTSANYTIFAPTDKAFEKLPHHHKASKETIKKVLLYHVSPDFYPAGRVLASHTIPTLLKEEVLDNQPQRLRVGLSLKGLTVNFYSRIIAINIFGSNGVIHGVDSIILPPPSTLKVIDLFPGEYSTLDLGLHKTGLHHDFAVTAQAGGTFFTPSNYAFQKLGPKINAFLFSSYGEKYLKALLKYHVISNTTIYSDAYYPYSGAGEEVQSFPKGKFHANLPTLLDGHDLSIDIARFGGFIRMQINGFTSVAIQDGIAKDGVLHVLSDVLIPPKTPGAAFWQGEDLTEEDLKERLEPFVEAEFEL